jgi:hypothetical protein
MLQTATAATGEFTEVLHPRADEPGLVEAFLPTACVQNHAANLCVLPGGDLGCVWFGGTQEGLPDISVWFSRLERSATRWCDPVQLSHDRDRSEQNPILFVAPDSRLWLLYTAQRFGNQDTAIVRFRTSDDGGRTWSEIGPAHSSASRRSSSTMAPGCCRCSTVAPRRAKSGTAVTISALSCAPRTAAGRGRKSPCREVSAACT